MGLTKQMWCVKMVWKVLMEVEIASFKTEETADLLVKKLKSDQWKGITYPKSFPKVYVMEEQ